jgi:hypothetical protein
MTDTEWEACTDPTPMLDHLRGGPDERKLRLFTVACCRRVWHLLADEQARHAVEVAERYADGLASKRELDIARDAFRDAQSEAFSASVDLNTAETAAVYCAYVAFSFTAMSDGWNAYGPSHYSATGAGWAACGSRGIAGAEQSAASAVADRAERAGQAALIREIFGLPSRSVIIERSRQTPAVVALAQAIYAGRAFDRMPELADALEETGCTDALILGHCREPGAHVRGCWLIDAVRGKK